MFILFMEFLVLLVHVVHCLNLKLCASIEGWIFLSFEEGSSRFTDVIVELSFLFCQMLVTENAKIWIL